MESTEGDAIYIEREHIVAAIELILEACEEGSLPKDPGELVLVMLSAVVSIVAASRPDSLSVLEAYRIIVEKISRLLSRAPIIYVNDTRLQ